MKGVLPNSLIVISKILGIYQAFKNRVTKLFDGLADFYHEFLMG